MSSWTPQEDAALRAALAKRMTATQAAAHLTAVFRREITRGAVIGRAHRTGVAINGDHPNNTNGRTIKPKRPSILPPSPSPSTFGPVSRDSTCKWPIGDPREQTFGFCGAIKPVDNCPYCAPHARIAYASIADRRRHDAFVRKGIGGAR